MWGWLLGLWALSQVAKPKPADSQSAPPGPAPTRKRPLGAPEYDAKLQRMEASLPHWTALGQKALHDWSTWLHKYRGGMPLGLFASVPCIESGWKMGSPGDVSLGEFGWYQIAASTPKLFGLDPELRKEREWNMFFAGAEYNLYAAKWGARYAGLASPDDQWKLARLSFAIGDPGARKLVAAAFRDLHEPTYADVLDFVDAGHAMPLGSQSAAKVAYRCHVVDLNWRLGKLVAPDEVSEQPSKVPTPDGRAYKFNP